MTLGRLGLAFAAVAALFLAAAWARGRRDRRNAAASAAEALLVTLLASLWFDSLGHGGWVLLFAFLGGLATGPEGWAAASGTGGGWRRLAAPLATVLRYVAGGGLLALILG